MLSNLKQPLSIVAAVLALLTCPMTANADTSGASSDSYTWSAELVALDESAGTAVVRSRTVNHANLEALAELPDGDRVTITWSGLTWGSGIRSITRGTASEADRFNLPAEFVSSEMDGQYVTFRVPVPEEALAKISSVEPGAWVTLTSPHRPAGWDEAVVDARPYNDVS